jgi:predicted RNase H-like HicB family nuclease
MGDSMKRYTVRYERDESGWWGGEVKEVRGCRTQGRTIAQVRRRIRDALALFVDDAKTTTLVDDVVLPAQARRSLATYREARVKADRESARAQESTLRAVRVLTKRLGLSTRDASELLGLSHQRIQQLAHERR